MRLLILFVSLGLLVASSSPAEAKRTKKVTQKSPTVSTNHNFDDHGVVGEYQMPDEALVKVENEKLLGDLLGVRKHFKDRLLKASEQE